VKFPLTLMHLVLTILAAACSGTSTPPLPRTQPTAGAGLSKVNHVIIVMMENHSFDNYFGALAYAPGSPYHSQRASGAADTLADLFDFANEKQKVFEPPANCAMKWSMSACESR
jgi:phospholipase C